MVCCFFLPWHRFAEDRMVFGDSSQQLWAFLIHPRMFFPPRPGPWVWYSNGPGSPDPLAPHLPFFSFFYFFLKFFFMVTKQIFIFIFSILFFTFLVTKRYTLQLYVIHWNPPVKDSQSQVSHGLILIYILHMVAPRQSGASASAAPTLHALTRRGLPLPLRSEGRRVGKECW